VRAVEMALAEIAAEVARSATCTTCASATDEGEIVNFHGLVDPELAGEAVHEKVDEMRARIAPPLASIKRVIGRRTATLRP